MDELAFDSKTDVGIRRSHNQDSHISIPAGDPETWQQRGHFFLVADGMGAHAVGELASKLAVDNLPLIYSKHAQEGAGLALKRAFIETNQYIYQRGQQNREFKGMGTTGTALVLRPDGAWVGHVGDSRAYRIRAGVIEQLSFDHSLLWELARRQNKNPEDMHGIPPNVIVRSLGPEAQVQVDVEGPHPIEPGDIYLLCSDGLSGQVSDREIGAVVSALPPTEACEFLVQLANLQGGPDNSTVIVVRIGGEPRIVPSASSEVVFREKPFYLLWRDYLVNSRKFVPWTFVLMAFGIILATTAVALSYAKLEQGGLIAFFLAGICLCSGLISLIIQNFRETRQSKVIMESSHPLQVYRQTSCRIDEALLQRLLHANESLRTGIREKNWQVEQSNYDRHLSRAIQFREKKQKTDAFRELCRALIVLMEAVHHQRGKEESFHPLWDRPSQASNHTTAG